MRRDDKINLYALREREKGEKRGAEKFLSFFCSSPPFFARENIYHFNHFGKGWLISSLFLFSVFLLPVLLFLYLFSHSFLTAARCFLSCLLSASWDLGRKEAKVLSSSKLFFLSIFLSRYRRRCLFVSGCNQLPRRNIAWIELTSFPPASLFFFPSPFCTHSRPGHVLLVAKSKAVVFFTRSTRPTSNVCGLTNCFWKI